jgi:two-component system CheB/CheR fusion protein
MNADQLSALRGVLARVLGPTAEVYRSSFLERRVAPRLAATHSADVAVYLDLLRRRPEEVWALCERLFVPTTEFFRNPEVFEALGELLAARSAEATWRTLRILSAPCSTGEEAASLSILLKEKGLCGKILAADRSPRALARLRGRRYPLKSVASLDKALKERYFRREGDVAWLDPGAARQIQPLLWDLGWGLPGRGFHAVVMRNFFIYLTAEAQARLLADAHGALVPGGLLVLGRVESIGRREMEGWRVVNRDARIYESTGGAG